MTQLFRCAESFSLDPGGLFRCSVVILPTKEFSEINFFAAAETKTIRCKRSARQKAEHFSEMNAASASKSLSATSEVFPAASKAH